MMSFNKKVLPAATRTMVVHETVSLRCNRRFMMMHFGWTRPTSLYETRKKRAAVIVNKRPKSWLLKQARTLEMQRRGEL